MRLLKLMKYVTKDKIEYMKTGGYRNLFGVFMVVGEVGNGKTLTSVEMALKEKEKDERIKIYTNFHMEGQDGQIEHWSDMLNIPSYSIIIIDEVQNTFSQRDWNSFPPQLIQLLTQNRKWGVNGEEERPPGVRMIFTTQDYENTDVMIRRLCNQVVHCNAFFGGRMVVNRFYKRKEYESSESKKRNNGMRWFVGSDELRNSYNTYKILTSMKKEEEQRKK